MAELKIARRRHVNPVLFAKVVRILLQYYRDHGADWVATQAMLEEHVLRAANHNRLKGQLRLDERTVRHVLYHLQRRGILLLRPQGPVTILANLSWDLVDPTWTGYSGVVDAALREPVLWVERDGRWFRHGLRGGARPFVYRLDALRPHLDAFTWARGWIHALNHGLLPDSVDAQRVVTEAVQEAVLGYVWACCQRPNGTPLERRVAGAMQGLGSYRRLSFTPKFGSLRKRTDAGVGPAARVALDALEAACAHRGVVRGGRRRGHPLRRVYEDLDALIYGHIQRKMVHLHATLRWQAWKRFLRLQDAGGPRRRPGLASPFTLHHAYAPFRLVAPLVRSLPPEARTLFMQSDRAWGSKVPPLW